jgi:hypothetical protein
MRASEAVSRMSSVALQAFLSRLPPGMAVHVLENPTSELREELAAAKAEGKGWSGVKMFARNFRQRAVAPMPMQQQQRSASSGNARLEENYLYGSRRFPVLTTNTIGSGGLTAGNFPYFTKGINDDGVSLGFPTGFTLTPAETNMEIGGSIAQGTSFVFNQLGITFDSDIATADIEVMLDATTLAFSKAGGQFSLSHGPLKFWPGGMGVAGFAAAAVGGTPLSQTAAHNGAADIRAVRTLKIPRVLREKETFQYSIQVHRTTKAKDGSTIGLTNFVIPTIWLFGGQRNVIPR